MKSPMPAPDCELRVPPAVMPWFIVQAARLEQAADLREVGGQHRAADVLEHADRGDLVPRLSSGSARVEQLHLHPPLRPRSLISWLTCAC
jgi:hypothetical protein